MIKTSIVADSIKLSLVRSLFNESKKYDDVIDFTLGDPDVHTADGIKSAACSAIINNHTRYSQNAGLLELRHAIQKYNELNEGICYNADGEIIVTVGAMEGLFLTLLATINKGDEVIIPAPYYVNYVQMVNICGGVPVIVSNDENPLRISTESINQAVTTKTKAILLNTPSNPSGMVVTDEELKTVAKIAKENDLIVITDEVYKCLIYDGINRPRSIASFDG